jgi:type VI protein secretion system component Hcp
MLACASGQHIKKAVLTCRKAGGEQEEYLKVTFSDLLVSSYHGGGAGELIGLLRPAGLIAKDVDKRSANVLPWDASNFLKWGDVAAASYHVGKSSAFSPQWGAGVTGRAGLATSLSQADDGPTELPAGAAAEIVPRDHISLNFAKIEFEYKEQKPDGSLGGTVKAGWDVKANKKV